MSSDQAMLGNELDAQLEALFSELREIYRIQYDRGNREALAKIAHLANNTLDTKRAGLPPLSNSRVPRGSSRMFVERTLKAGPKSISEIRRNAVTTIERALSYQTIRLELLRGTKERRYRKTNRRWSLNK